MSLNPTKIEWCTHTWNPVTGCFHGCPYCYAREVARRFGGQDAPEFDGQDIRVDRSGGKPFPYGFFPTFYPDRLDEPFLSKKHKDIFVCSMADLFGDWVPLDIIDRVLAACEDAEQHTYIYLTKNPSRYEDLMRNRLPKRNNFFYGTTVTDLTCREDYLPVLPDVNTFWSIEPLLGPVNLGTIPTAQMPDRIIIGAETGNRKSRITPRREWVERILAECAEIGIPVFTKNSIRKLFPDLPPFSFTWEVG